MPALPVIPNVYEVSTIGLLYNKPCDHVIHYATPVAPGQEGAACASFAARDKEFWLPTFGILLPGAYEHVSTQVKYLGSVTVPEFIEPVNEFGSMAVSAMPALVAVTIRHQSPVRGKGLDGRTNIPSPAYGVMASSDHYSLNTTDQLQYTNLFLSYTQQLTTAVEADLGLLDRPQLVIAHRTRGTYSVPLSSTCDPYLTTHRRWVKRLARHRRS